MKELLLIRHAKSSWEDATLKDFERPLNERGLRDAPIMAEKLVEKGIVPDLFLSSPSKRTMQTCRYFLEAFHEDMSKLVLDPPLYEASADTLNKEIKNINDKFNTVLVFTHNTGLTGFVNQLTNVHVDNIPTCGIFAVKVDTKHWKNFPKADKKFWFFDYPKLYV